MFGWFKKKDDDFKFLGALVKNDSGLYLVLEAPLAAIPVYGLDLDTVGSTKEGLVPAYTLVKDLGIEVDGKPALYVVSDEST